MSLIQAVILGVVQGLTEFLPLSSSGHLVIATKLLGLQPNVTFDVLLHLATLIAVCVFFMPDIILIIKAFLTDRRMENQYFKLGLLVLTASVPTAIIGFAFEHKFEEMFGSVAAVGGFLILTGILLFLAQTYAKAKKGLKNVSFIDALIIGTAQGCAVAPGLSRSGTTISASLLLGLDRVLAARFSFLLSIPAILGASLFKSKQIFHGTSFNMMAGFFAAMVVGYLAIWLFIKIIEKLDLRLFSYYCFIAGIIAMFFIK